MPPLVLAYHAVARELAPGLVREMVATVDELVAEVTQLRHDGRRFVAAGELTGAEDEVALTFDDGWADALTVAAPLLHELAVPATFYVCPGLFGNTEDRGYSPEGRVLTREEAGLLHEAGMELGAHSMHHPDLVAVDDAVLRAELAGSRAAVETITGAPCRTFAYPFGSHDARVRAATQAAGFALAFQYGPGPWAPFAAPRTPRP
jgi:peptidoglycan/xylan/chitin deacetylase (PgdA/CDA1 family)